MADNLFLPVNRKDMEHRGWEELDFVLVTGDAYVDHPSLARLWWVDCWNRKVFGWVSLPSRILPAVKA